MRAVELSNGDQRVQAVELRDGVHFAICSKSDAKWRLHGGERDVTLREFVTRYTDAQQSWEIVRVWGTF